MDVRTMTIAQSTFVILTEGTRTLDLLLAPGKTPKTSMLESVAEMREQAGTLTKRADFTEAAVRHI